MTLKSEGAIQGPQQQSSHEYLPVFFILVLSCCKRKRLSMKTAKIPCIELLLVKSASSKQSNSTQFIPDEQCSEKKPRHLSLSRATLIQSSPCHSVSLRYLLILSSHLRIALSKTCMHFSPHTCYIPRPSQSL